MKKISIVILMLFLIACSSNTVIPLPPNAKKSTSACPKATLQEGECFSVPTTHNETIDWYMNKSKDKGWTFNITSDDEPFSYNLIIEDKSIMIYFYRQPGEQSTGLLVK